MEFSLTLTIIAPDVPRFIESDRNKIHRILLNLLGNAIKFTQSGRITLVIDCLHLDSKNVHLKLGVSDTGIGIPEEVQSQVFNRFFKVSSSYKGIYTEHGLGLHIAQSYVTLLGGHITPTPIIGLTGHAKEAAWDECQKAGMNEVLSKPAQIEALEACLLKILNQPPACNDSSLTQETKSSLGIDLPDTEEDLFQLDSFPFFNEQKALELIPDKNLLITLLKTFLSDEIQKDIMQIQSEYQKGNWEEVEKLAHKIKGGVAYLGTEKMFYACQYLERYYKAGHRVMLEPLYQQLIEVNQGTIKELTLWLASVVPPIC